MVRNPENRLSHVKVYMRWENNRVHGSRYLSSGLSILMHSVISLQDVTSYDKNHCTVQCTCILLLQKESIMLLLGFVHKSSFMVI